MKTAEHIETDLVMPSNNEVVYLPLGLLGFEWIKRYVWRESPDEAPFRWLQAVEEPALTFLVVPPSQVLSDYEPELTDEDVAFLGLNCPLDAFIVNIVTLRPGGRATVNLKGPIIFNRWTRRGKQIVPVNAALYALQFPLPVVE